MRHFFTTRVKVVLITAVLLAAILTVVGSLTGLSLPDMFVKGILTPIRSGFSQLTISVICINRIIYNLIIKQLSYISFSHYSPSPSFSIVSNSTLRIIAFVDSSLFT